jgi:hypothetical protein
MFESYKEYLYVPPGDPFRNESINRRYRATQWDRVSNDVASASLAIMADIRSTMANSHDELECE